MVNTLAPSSVWAKPISSVPRQVTELSAADIASQSTPMPPRPRRAWLPTRIDPPAMAVKLPLEFPGRASSFHPKRRSASDNRRIVN
jgi:hypothetical protein